MPRVPGNLATLGSAATKPGVSRAPPQGAGEGLPSLPGAGTLRPWAGVSASITTRCLPWECLRVHGPCEEPAPGVRDHPVQPDLSVTQYVGKTPFPNKVALRRPGRTRVPGGAVQPRAALDAATRHKSAAAGLWEGPRGFGRNKDESTKRPHAGPVRGHVLPVLDAASEEGPSGSWDDSPLCAAGRGAGQRSSGAADEGRPRHIQVQEKRRPGPVLSSRPLPAPPTAQGAARGAAFTGARKPLGLVQRPRRPPEGRQGPDITLRARPACRWRVSHHLEVTLYKIKHRDSTK